jgi:4-hydroxy-tetrahydrodipicolinate synthase
LGGAGTTMPAPAAEIARGVIDAWHEGDVQRACALQLQFALFPARWMHKGLTPTMKAALAMIGCPAGAMHAPWQDLSEQEKADLAAFLRGTLLGRHMTARAA